MKIQGDSIYRNKIIWAYTISSTSHDSDLLARVVHLINDDELTLGQKYKELCRSKLFDSEMSLKNP